MRIGVLLNAPDKVKPFSGDNFRLNARSPRKSEDTMENLVIEGGLPLRGEISVSGSKNAALPILMASILLNGPAVFTNVPDLRDIHTTLRLLEILGCPCSFRNGRVEVSPGPLQSEAPYDLVKTMRASVLCLGPLLARLGVARVAMPGGLAIGARPVNLHLSALERMGAEFELEEGYIHGKCAGLRGAHIQFDFPTVGGTENLLMAACLAEGETVLENVAREPEVVDLARFLIRCGAEIEGHGSSVIRVRACARSTAVNTRSCRIASRQEPFWPRQASRAGSFC